HEWVGRTHYTQLRLDPLGRESSAEMLSALLGDHAELDPLKRLIIERTQGNPFFIEEMVQALFDEGALVCNGQVGLKKPLPQITIPATVQAVVASRIDRLPPTAKELLQLLAVMGREFTLSLVRQVAAVAEPELDDMLSDLQRSEFIYEQPASPDPQYAF